MGERRILLIIGDFVMAMLSLAFGVYFWASAEAQQLPLFNFLQERLEPWFFLLPLIWLILLVEMYDHHRASDLRRTVRGIALAALIGIGLYMVVFFISTPGSLPRRGVAGFVLAATILTLLWRMLYIRVFTLPQFMRRAVLVGAGVTGQALLSVVNALPQAPFTLAALLDDDPELDGKTIEGYKVVGGCDKLPEIIERENASDVIVAISGKIEDNTFRTLLEAQERGAEITRMPSAYEEVLGRVPVHYLEADWILRSFVDEARTSNFYFLAKRIVDIIGGLVGVGILAVIGPFISLAILLETGRPIVFSQTRSGKGGRPYRIMKFRTMRQDAEKNGAQLAKENDDRATRLGRFLRKSHLDEWPQFINVLRGEMSLVGPRPERPELMEHFQEQIPFYRARLLAKPGVAGWAQVNFGYAANLDDMVVKLEYDLYYIKHRNIGLDIVIILRTLGTIFGFRGR